MKELIIFKAFLMIFMIPLIVHAEATQIEVLGKIRMQGKDIKLIRSDEEIVIPGLFQDEKIKTIITNLDPDDETFVKGHVIYQKLDADGVGQMRPVFMIESVTPISLRRIGDIGSMQDYAKDPTPVMTINNEFSPWAIPVSTKVASAMTLTSAMLLMQSLTSSPLQPHGVQQINSGLFIFAGALMTGVFIYEQVSNQNKKQAQD